MSLRSAPERTREGGRRRSARGVSRECRRSCAARKPAEAPRGAQRCDGAEAPAQAFRRDSAPEVPRTTASTTLIRGGLLRVRRLSGNWRCCKVSWTNSGVVRDGRAHFADGLADCPGRPERTAAPSERGRPPEQPGWTNGDFSGCIPGLRPCPPLGFTRSVAAPSCCRAPGGDRRVAPGFRPAPQLTAKLQGCSDDLPRLVRYPQRFVALTKSGTA